MHHQSNTKTHNWLSAGGIRCSDLSMESLPLSHDFCQSDISPVPGPRCVWLVHHCCKKRWPLSELTELKLRSNFVGKTSCSLCCRQDVFTGRLLTGSMAQSPSQHQCNSNTPRLKSLGSRSNRPYKLVWFCIKVDSVYIYSIFTTLH